MRGSPSVVVIDAEAARERFESGQKVALRRVGTTGSVIWQSCATRWARTWDEFATNPRWWGDDVDTEFVMPAPGHRDTYDDAAGYIFRREPFEVGHISGTYAFNTPPRDRLARFFGDLPQQWIDVFFEHFNGEPDGFSGVDYVVWSYQTVIAWVRRGGEVVMPPVRYSNTTTQHQHLVARAFGVPFTSTESARKGKGKSPYGPRAGGY